MNFIERLESLDVNPAEYLKMVRTIAKYNGYNYKNLNFSDRIDKKLMIRSNGKTSHFGSTNYQDYIILIQGYKEGLLSKEQVKETRSRYLKRSGSIKGNWKDNDFSPNNLSRRILWDSEKIIKNL